MAGGLAPQPAVSGVEKMKPTLSRRDFLRLGIPIVVLPVIPILERLASHVFQVESQPNIIMILFDALSARHLSLYGYPRQTCPNLERFARIATVYHQHHAAANYTTPSTASLFTGVYPFTHRVFAINGLVTPDVRSQNLLTTLQPTHRAAALVQNMYADLVLYQLRKHLDTHHGPTAFTLAGKTLYDHIFPNDRVLAAKAYDQFLFDPKETPGSLFAALPLDIYRQINKRQAQEGWSKDYPEGLPFLDFAKAHFTIEQVVTGAQSLLKGLNAPYFSYLHFMPPHAPYRPGKEFIGRFKDGWTPKKKTLHPLGSQKTQARLNELRRNYDEFVAHLDAGFGKLLDFLEASGLLDNSYIIFTSDHGELFERGEDGHVSPLLYEEILHIPLLIHTPGQAVRQDVKILTSNVDLYPTLAALTGQHTPTELAGYPLPGLGLAEPHSDRSAWALEAKLNSAHAPLSKASLALLKWPHKLIRYWGYNVEDRYEFYNLANDPEELEDLYESHPLAGEFQAQMELKLHEIDQPYFGKK